MYSHEQLINAVRAAGRDGRTFSVKDVRSELGFQTRDKKELSRFRRRLRAFEDQLEKVGTNSYRLKPGAFEADMSDTPKKLAQEPASGVFETVAAVQAAPVLDAVVLVQAAAASEPEAPSQLVYQEQVSEEASPPSAAAPTSHQDPAALEAVFAAALPHAAEQVAAVDTVKEVAAAPSVTMQVAEQPHAAQAAHDDVVAAVPTRVAEHATTNGAPKPAAAAYSATNGAAAKPAPQPSAAVAAPHQPSGHSVSVVQRAVKLAATVLTSALAASAAVSGRVRERSHNLREQLWGCIQAVPSKQHAIARLRGWAENLRPLSGQVRDQLNALRQRVRRA